MGNVSGRKDVSNELKRGGPNCVGPAGGLNERKCRTSIEKKKKMVSGGPYG